MGTVVTVMNMKGGVGKTTVAMHLGGLISRYEINGNQYDINRYVGIFHSAMDDSLPIRRYGDQPGDDGSLVTCLLPRTGRNDAIRVYQFGQIDQTNRDKQVMLDARYTIDLP